MSYQVLARKWRPKTFQHMVGQAHVLKALENALNQNRLHHAYLFTGTRGVGKTTLARILAKCLNCDNGVSATPCGECNACVSIDTGKFLDLIEVDAASRAKVEETRDLMDNVQYAPTSGRYKIYLIDEVHMFSNHSFNALLKTLEEPPPHVKFLLATTESKKIPITILSRCLQFNLNHLSSEQIDEQLKTILTKEAITFDADATELIARSAEGSMRDALSLLDQAIAYTNGQLNNQAVREMIGTIDKVDFNKLLQALIAADPDQLLETIAAIALQNPDFDALLTELLSLLQKIAVIQLLPKDTDNPLKSDPVLSTFAEQMDKEEVQLYYQIGMIGRKDLHLAPDLKSGFEMVMIRMLAFKPGSVDVAARQASVHHRATKKVAPTPLPAAEDTKSHAATQKPSTAQQDWADIVNQLTLAGPVKELAKNCSLKRRTPTQIELNAAETAKYLLTDNQSKLEKALQQYFDSTLQLTISVGHIDDETPAQKETREGVEKRQKIKASINEDPHVKSLMENFDATIEEDSIQYR